MPQSVLRIAKSALEWMKKARTYNDSRRAKELSKLGQALRDADSSNPVP
jgi:hypothetical protein